MKTKSDMKPFIIAALSLTLLVGCGNDDFPGRRTESSSGDYFCVCNGGCADACCYAGIAYIRFDRSFFGRPGPEPVMTKKTIYSMIIM